LINLQSYIAAAIRYLPEDDPMYKCIEYCEKHHIDPWILAEDMCAWMERKKYRVEEI